MDILMNSNISDNISSLIDQYGELFNSFDNIYLFGSVLNIEEAPNDIDILLIYSKYSDIIINHLNIINSAFKNLSELPIDLTVLSVEEEKDTNFLKRLNSKYLRLK